MTDHEVIEFTKSLFNLIQNARTIIDLEEIPHKLNIPAKNLMKIEGYPKIEFAIKSSDIQSLIDKNVLDDEFNFMSDISTKLTDPFSKLLYATAWKNGDLKKIKHIIKGIIDSENDNNNNDQNEALVFYQFGKYLTKKSGQPIIDQHVIRAFSIFSSKNTNQISSIRQLKVLDKIHIPIINQYKEWLTSDALTKELREVKDYTYHIDKLLFAAGKTIKSHAQALNL